MRDEKGFLIRCIHSEWRIIDAQDNKDYVCMNELLTLEHYCYADEQCRLYNPDIKKERKDD